MGDAYWIIEYSLEFLSDFHVGEGTTLIGGNLHGLRLDENGFPFMPHTQVKGLLRWGGKKIENWRPQLAARRRRNFPTARDSHDCVWWSFTNACFPGAETRSWSPDTVDLLGAQAHIHIEDGGVRNLFAYQKGRGPGARWKWRGTIYSVEPGNDFDVAFLVNCMRAEDRVGARRSRGYGKVDWLPTAIRSYQAGAAGMADMKAEPVDLEYWVDKLLSEEVAE